MLSLRVVVAPAYFDNSLGLTELKEVLSEKQLIPKAAIEALPVSVLSGRSSLEKCGLCSDCINPVLDSFRDKLVTIVRSDERGHATQYEHVGRSVDHTD